MVLPPLAGFPAESDEPDRLPEPPRALSDIDELGATTLQKQGGLAPNDLAAINRAAAEVTAIDRRQADRIAAASIERLRGSVR